MPPASPLAPVEDGANAPAPPSEAKAAPADVPAHHGAPAELQLRNWPARSDVLLVGFWALMASVLGRGLAPALPGSSAGIGQLIVGVEDLGAFSSQFMLMMGTAVCVRLLLTTLECRSYLFRPVAIVTCAAALPVVVSASSRHLSPEWLIALVGLSATLALASAMPALRAPQCRVAGLVLLTVTLGSLVSAAGRTIALYASQQVEATLFMVARGIATFGLLLDALSVAWVALWLARRLHLRGAWLIGGAIAVSLVVVWTGRQVDAEDSATWGLVAGRALAALTAHPDPFIGSGVRYFVEVLALLLAAITLWFQRPAGVGATLSFALLARVSGDVPLCALMLMLAALSAVRASLQSVEPDTSAREPPGRRAPLEVIPATR
jgi:hypothetical protein